MPSDRSDDKLARFASRVVALQEEQRAREEAEQSKRVDAAAMRDIARELGMSDDDVVKLAAEGQARKQRAKALRAQSMLDEAIDELESASAFNPDDVDAGLMLADALYTRANRSGNAIELERARRIALDVLRAAPGNAEAASLLNAIKNVPDAAAVERTRSVAFFVGIVGVLVVVAGLVAVLLALR